MSFLVVASYFIGQYMELGKIGIFQSIDGMSMAFLTMNFIELFHAICMRSQKNSIFTLKHFNWWLFAAFVFTVVITLAVIYIPFFVNVFGFASISIKEFLIGFGLAFLIVPIIELGKLLERKLIK